MKMKERPARPLPVHPGGILLTERWMRLAFRIMVFVCALIMLSDTSPVSGGAVESALAERIQAYWSAKSNNDFRSAYAMESPRLQGELSLEKYEELNLNPMSRISGVDISNIVVNGNQGQAEVIFHLAIKQGPSSFSVAAPKRTDEWEWIEGTWYKKYYPTEILFPIKQMTSPQGGR